MILGNMKKYISESNKKNKEYSLYGFVPVIIKDNFVKEINLRHVLSLVEKKIPEKLCLNLDVIYIGNFEEFSEREVNAFFRNGALFLTNDQDDEEDLLDDIIHEIAHSNEAPYSFIIYGDQKLQQEFLDKREKIEEILNSKNIDTSIVDFSYIEYSQEFDMFLYQDIGYERLSPLIPELFVNPYSITSIREYYATGFEYYYLKDLLKLKEICPILYNKIKIIDSLEEE